MSFGEVLTAMVTPFNEQQEVEYKQAAKLAQKLVDNGSDGLVVLGTTGEVPTLSEEEKLKLLETVVEQVGDEATIIAGSGCYSTAESIKFSQQAAKTGVDALMLVGPYYNKPPQYALYNHFKEIANSVELPIVVYNVPSRTGKNIEPETVVKLAEIENIKAVKEASGDICQITKLSRLTDDQFKIYSGDDSLTLPAIAVGADGVISVASHLVGKQMKRMIQHHQQGNVKQAREINQELGELFNILFIKTNPIPIKKALNLIGLEVGKLRAPLYELPDELTAQLKEVLTNYELI